MTAHIVHASTRQPLPAERFPVWPLGLIGHNPAAGQLWERVAEGVIRGENYPTALAEQRADNYAGNGTDRLNVELDAEGRRS